MEVALAAIAILWFLFSRNADTIETPEATVNSGNTDLDWRGALRKWATQLGVDPDIADAIGGTETDWHPAVNDTGGDAKRGGSYGPTQISEKTARATGYTGEMTDFNTNPELVGEWTARILLNRPGGAPTDVKSAGAWWNAGLVETGEGRWYSPEKQEVQDDLPASTEYKYIPRLAAHYAFVTSEQGLTGLLSQS